MTRLLLCSGCILALSGVCAPTVSAAKDDIPDARAFFLKGQAAYQVGDYLGAIHEWNRAYDLDPRPLLQYNIAQAYERLGDLEKTVEALERYLEKSSGTDLKQSEARAKLTSLRERLSQTSILFRGGPPGARLMIDEQDWGQLPRPDPVPVAPGSHRVVVRHAHYLDFVSMVVVPAGQRIEVPVELNRNTAILMSDTKKKPKSSYGPWLLMGSGAAALTGGVILGVIASGKAEDAPTQDGALADKARQLGLIADITMGAGLGLATAGLIWWLLAPTPQIHLPVTMAPHLNKSFVGADMMVRF